MDHVLGGLAFGVCFELSILRIVVLIAWTPAWAFGFANNGGIDGQGSEVGGQGSQGSDQGNGRNQKGDAINDNIQGDVRNVIENDNHRGCTYKEFLACNPKEDDGKGGAKVYTRWIKKIESVQDMSGVGIIRREEFCPVNEMQKLETEFWNHAMVGAGYAAYTDSSMSWLGMVAATEPTTIQRAVQKARTLTDEAVRNGSLKKNPEKRENSGEASRDNNARDDNKRTRTGNTFDTTTNPVRRDYNGPIPKYVNYNLHHPPEMPCRAYFNYGRTGHMAKDCRVAPKMVNPMNARNPIAAREACFECGGTNHFKAACSRLYQAKRPEGGRLNQVVAIDVGQGRGNNDKQARGRALCQEQKRLARTRTS
ncbi:putative reverse transcriptase domain-containing protein [Tanacetum coccineum]